MKEKLSNESIKKIAKTIKGQEEFDPGVEAYLIFDMIEEYAQKFSVNEKYDIYEELIPILKAGY